MWEWLYEWAPFGWRVQFSPLACVIIVICTAILVVGVQESAWVNLVMTVFNLILILFVILYGATFIHPWNWSPFMPYGFSGVFHGAAVVFFSYVGFDAVTTLAGEVQNTKRDLPIGIVGTLTIVTGLYCAVSLVITGMIPYNSIDPDAGLSNVCFFSSFSPFSLFSAFSFLLSPSCLFFFFFFFLPSFPLYPFSSPFLFLELNVAFPSLSFPSLFFPFLFIREHLYYPSILYWIPSSPSPFSSPLPLYSISPFPSLLLFLVYLVLFLVLKEEIKYKY